VTAQASISNSVDKHKFTYTTHVAKSSPQHSQNLISDDIHRTTQKALFHIAAHITTHNRTTVSTILSHLLAIT